MSSGLGSRLGNSAPPAPVVGMQRAHPAPGLPKKLTALLWPQGCSRERELLQYQAHDEGAESSSIPGATAGDREFLQHWGRNGERELSSPVAALGPDELSAPPHGPGAGAVLSHLLAVELEKLAVA